MKQRLIDANALESPLNWAVFSHKQYKYLLNVIRSTPTVDAEPVRYAHWIETADTDLGTAYICSDCSRGIFICGDESLEQYPYCHCGAKMIKHTLKCPSYLEQDGGRCLGTKEVDRCSCNGNKKNCDFYQKVRDEE